MKLIVIMTVMLFNSVFGFQSNKIVGSWKGILTAGMQQLTIIVNLSEVEGKLKCSFDSPDQGATGIPFDKATFENNVLKLEKDNKAIQYEGTLSENGLEIVGKFIQGQVFELNLKKINPSEKKESEIKTELPEKYFGIWRGLLNANGDDIEMIFNINKNGKATIDIPQQGAKGLPFTLVNFDGKNLILKLSSVAASFEGELTPKNELKGFWKQSGVNFPMTLVKGEAPVEKPKPQDPIPPYNYNEEEVSFTNQKDNVTLSGTLTLPKGTGNFPAVILVSGSGQQDRNSNIFGHKSFWIIADHLTKNGIAVLRYDDRGVGKSGGMETLNSATTENFAYDAKAALEFLRNHKRINKTKTGIIGHSEGGAIAEIIAADDKNLAYAILLGAPGVSGEEILYTQGKALMQVSGVPENIIKKNNELQKQLFELVKQDLSSEKLKQLAFDKAEKFVKDLTEEEKTQLGLNEQTIHPQILRAISPWMAYFVKFNPSEYLKKIKCPVLALNGEKDLQVSVKENLGNIKKILTKTGNKYNEYVALNDLNHLFQTCKKGTIDEYGSIEETFAPVALNKISDWLKKVVK